MKRENHQLYCTLRGLSPGILFTLGALLAVLGILGCFVPILPGPILAYASLWMFPSHVGATRLSLASAAVLLATIIDYVLPAVVSKKFNCSKLGVTGCFIGTIVGVFFFPLGLILGPVLGAMAGELFAGKGGLGVVRGGVSALIGFVATILVKFAAVTLCVWWFCQCCPHCP